MAKRERAEDDRNWPHLLSVGVLIGSVGGVLILGAALHDTSDPPERPAFDRRGARSPAEPPPLPAPPRAIEPRDVLARRTADDLARVAASADRWTSQLAVLCNPALPRRLAAEFRHEPQLYVLPTSFEGKDCFAITWNQYPSKDRALAAAGLPPSLRSIGSQPFARKFADLLTEPR